MTCGWRWPRWPRRTTTGGSGRRTFQHRFGGNGALAGHPVGNLLLVGLFEVLGRPGGGAGRRRPAARRARPGAADVLRAAGHRRRRRRAGRRPAGGPADPRPGGGGRDARQVRAVAARARRRARPARRRWRRSWTPMWWCSARFVVHQRAAAPVGARARRCAGRRTRRTGWWCSIWPRSRGRPRGSRRSSTWTYSPNTLPASGRRGARRRRRGCPARRLQLDGRRGWEHGWSWRAIARSRRQPRHDPVALRRHGAGA